MATAKQIPVVTSIPLLSIYTAPDWCSDSFYTYHPISTTIPGPSQFLRAQTGEDGRGLDTRYAECYPPRFTYFNELFTATPRQKAIYSPGVCPSGWTSWAVPKSSSVTANYVTSYVCCPLGFQWENNQACKSAAATATVVAINESRNRTIQPPYVLLEWPINIAWASSDLDKFSPASAPLILSQQTRLSENDGSSGGLSTGALAGIGVGVGVLCLALIALLVFLLIFRRRHRQRELDEKEQRRPSPDFQEYQQPRSPPGYESPIGTPRLGTPTYYAPKVASGMESPGVASELSTSSEKRIPSELDSRRVSEMELQKPYGAYLSPELDGTPVFEVHGDPMRHSRHTFTNDELGNLGWAPTPGLRSSAGRARGGLGPSPYNDSPTLPPSDPLGGSSGVPSTAGSTMQGRWRDSHPEYGYAQTP